jgi:fructokinase
MSTSDEAVVVWGEVLWDRFPDGAQLGGAPANVAWHLGLAGGWSRLVTRVGDDDDGRLAIARLSECVDTSLIQIDPERATGEVTIAVENGEPRYTMHHGRAWERIACTDAVRTAISEAGVFLFGTLSQLAPEGLASWRQAVESAQASCMKVCDVNLRRTTGGVLAGTGPRPSNDVALEGEHLAVYEAIHAADLIKVNDRELAALARWLGWADPIASLRGPRHKIVVVTHGEDGSTLHGDGPPIRIEGVRAPPGGDNVGCGDAYLAILVLGLTMGWDLETSGRAASRYAAAVAAVRGATPLFTDEQIAELLGAE